MHTAHRQLQEEADVPVGMVDGGLQLPSQEAPGLVVVALGGEEGGEAAGCVEPHSLQVGCSPSHQHLVETHTVLEYLPPSLVGTLTAFSSCCLASEVHEVCSLSSRPRRSRTLASSRGTGCSASTPSRQRTASLTDSGRWDKKNSAIASRAVTVGLRDGGKYPLHSSGYIHVPNCLARSHYSLVSRCVAHDNLKVGVK